PNELEASTDQSGYSFPWMPLQEVLDGTLNNRTELHGRLGEPKLRTITSQAQQLCNYQFPIQIIQERHYEDVAEIFARVNSLGTPLTGAEIHLARLVPHWKGITKEFRAYRRELRYRKFDLDLSFLMRAITAIECHAAQIAKLSQRMAKERVSEKHLRRAWRLARQSINRVISVLDSELKLDRAHYLPSKNALIPLVYYVAR